MAGYIYIMASKRNGTLYVGVTSDLVRRVYEHKTNQLQGFTQKYAIHNLVWYDIAETMDAAILREKQVKKWNRAWKQRLIEETNPEWLDLYPSICGFPPARE